MNYQGRALAEIFRDSFAVSVGADRFHVLSALEREAMRWLTTDLAGVGVDAHHKSLIPDFVTLHGLEAIEEGFGEIDAMIERN